MRTVSRRVLARIAAAVALAAPVALAGCPAAPPPARPAPPAEAPGPRLVVLLVVDQLPAWAFEAKRAALTGGFDRLLREGEWHRGRYPSPATLTACNHAMLGTGEPPEASGILANEWWRRDAERMLGSVNDVDGTLTTRWLRVPGLGDATAAAGTGAKAVAVSLKERAALLPLGHRGVAVWYDKTRLAFVSRSPLPWLAEHARSHPPSAHLGAVWTPLDPARIAELSGVPDAAPGELGGRGLDTTFPHAIGETPDPADAMLATPIGNQLVLDAAVAAIDGERLGADAVADLLVVSLSSHDHVGHSWGHESWEAWDTLLRLDQQLAGFLAALDARVGAGRWALLLTSDHGASPMPERIGGGRINYESIKDAANRAAIAELGPGDWIASAKYPTVFLTAAARAVAPKQRAVLLRKIVYALRAFPGIAVVERTDKFAGDCDRRTGDAFAYCLMLDRERSGEVFYLPRRGWVLQPADDPAATGHGSFHDYDTTVPVIMLPHGRRPHAALAAPDDAMIYMVRIAVVLSRWLGVAPPSSLPRPAPPPAAP